MNLLAAKKIIDSRNELGYTQDYMAKELAKALDQTYSKRQYQKLEEGKFPKYKKEIVRALDAILDTEIYKMVYEQKVPRGTFDTTTPLYSPAELKRKIEEQWQVIMSQQETIRLIARKGDPPKEGFPPLRTG